MDSQVTLVAPNIDHRHETNTVFVLTPDNPKTTTISSRESRKASYMVESSNTGSKTWVYKFDEDHQKSLLAYIERNGLKPDKVAFRGDEAIPMSSWLKTRPFESFPASFEANGNKYVWHMNIIRQLALFIEGESAPVAWFNKSQRQTLDGKLIEVEPACIFLRPEVGGIVDIVIVSMLVLEHKNRMEAKAEIPFQWQVMR